MSSISNTGVPPADYAPPVGAPGVHRSTPRAAVSAARGRGARGTEASLISPPDLPSVGAARLLDAPNMAPEPIKVMFGPGLF